MTEEVILWDCGYLDEGEEVCCEFPEDWIFGGADNLHPGADPRWEASVYRYLNEYAEEVFITTAPICEHQALDQFTDVSSFGDTHPRYLEIRGPGEREFITLGWEYREANDTLYRLVE